MIKPESIASLVAAFLLAGCTTAERCARRFPPVVIEREVLRHDTLIAVGSTHLDTVIIHPTDTLRLVNDRLNVVFHQRHDTVRLWAQCAPDTVRLPVVREVIRLAPAPAGPAGSPWVWLLMGAAAALLLRKLFFV